MGNCDCCAAVRRSPRNRRGCASPRPWRFRPCGPPGPHEPVAVRPERWLMWLLTLVDVGEQPYTGRVAVRLVVRRHRECGPAGAAPAWNGRSRTGAHRAADGRSVLRHPVRASRARARRRRRGSFPGPRRSRLIAAAPSNSLMARPPISLHAADIRQEKATRPDHRGQPIAARSSRLRRGVPAWHRATLLCPRASWMNRVGCAPRLDPTRLPVGQASSSDLAE